MNWLRKGKKFDCTNNLINHPTLFLFLGRATSSLVSIIVSSRIITGWERKNPA